MASDNTDDGIVVRSATPPTGSWTPSTEELLAWAETMARKPPTRRRGFELLTALRGRALMALVVVLILVALGPPLFAFAPRHVHTPQAGPTVPTVTGPRDDTVKPSAPAGVQVTSRASDTITLVWMPATDNVRVAGYIIVRNGAQIGTSYEPGFTDTGLQPATTYQYTITAFDDTGNISDPSQPVSVQTLDAPDTMAPTAPTGLTVTRRGTTSVTLTWSPAWDEIGVAGYDVFRDGNWIATVWRTEFTDVGLTPGTTYRYRLTAFDATNNTSPYSSSVSVTTDKSPTTPPPTTRPPTQPTSTTAPVNPPPPSDPDPTGPTGTPSTPPTSEPPTTDPTTPATTDPEPTETTTSTEPPDDPTDPPTDEPTETLTLPLPTETSTLPLPTDSTDLPVGMPNGDQAGNPNGDVAGNPGDDLVDTSGQILTVAADSVTMAADSLLTTVDSVVTSTMPVGQTGTSDPLAAVGELFAGDDARREEEN